MQNSPKVSIICPTYNVAEYLDRCLQSIYEQKCHDVLEVIIQDGLSSDNTLEVASGWADKIDIRIFAEADKGIYDAMNKATTKVRGDWVYFMGADDYLLPEFSDMVLDDLRDKTKVYYANVLVFGKKHNGKYTKKKLALMSICHQAILYPKAVFEQYLYDLRYVVRADHVLNIQLFGGKAFHFVYIDKLIGYFNVTGFSSCHEDQYYLKNEMSLIFKYLGLWTYLRIKKRKYKAMKNAKKEQG